MKKIIIMGVCLALLILSGCQSTPEEDVVTPEPTPEVEPTPVEPDPAPEPVVVEDFSEANEALIASTTEAREKAIAAGADIYFSDELLVVDVASTEALTVYKEGGDAKVFNELAADFMYQYQALEQAAIAAKTQEKILEMGFESYDLDNYNAGNVASNNAYELFNSGADGKAIYDEVKKAADSYNLVLRTGYIAVANESRSEFLAVKVKADEIKASVADKANYANAIVFFTQGDADLLSDNPESAYENFQIATGQMTSIYNSVLEKRALAQDAMDRARRRTESANEVAVAADEKVPLADVEALGNVSETENTQEGE